MLSINLVTASSFNIDNSNLPRLKQNTGFSIGFDNDNNNLPKLICNGTTSSNLFSCTGTPTPCSMFDVSSCSQNNYHNNKCSVSDTSSCNGQYPTDCSGISYSDCSTYTGCTPYSNPESCSGSYAGQCTCGGSYPNCDCGGQYNGCGGTYNNPHSCSGFDWYTCTYGGYSGCSYHSSDDYTNCDGTYYSQDSCVGFDYNTCSATSGCSVDAYCYGGTYSCSIGCTLGDCSQVGCTYNSGSSGCSGSYNSDCNIFNQNDCINGGHSGCSWATGNSCIDVNGGNSCTTITDSNTCNSEAGCSFNNLIGGSKKCKSQFI